MFNFLHNLIQWVLLFFNFTLEICSFGGMISVFQSFSDAQLYWVLGMNNFVLWIEYYGRCPMLLRVLSTLFSLTLASGPLSPVVTTKMICTSVTKLTRVQSHWLKVTHLGSTANRTRGLFLFPLWLWTYLQTFYYYFFIWLLLELPKPPLY